MFRVSPTFLVVRVDAWEEKENKMLERKKAEKRQMLLCSSGTSSVTLGQGEGKRREQGRGKC